MRIVYLNPCGQLGGAETSLRELLASIRSAAPEWELWLVLGEDGPLAEVAREIGVKVILVPFPAALARLGDSGNGRVAILWSFLKAAWGTGLYTRRLHRVLESLEPQIIHTNGFKMHLLGAWTRPFQTPLVWHIHDYVSTRTLMSHLLRLFSNACSAAIVNSKSVAADLKALLPDLKIVPIYNAVNLVRFAPDGQKLDLDAISRLAPAAPGTLRVGLVATFARWKGHRVFLQALSRLPSDVPVRGYIIGGPIYQTGGSQWSRLELDQEAALLGLAGKVGFTGLLNDPAAAMRSLDVIVHASTQPEPFGMVIIEGMACGKAVIASQAGGATEIIESEVDALSHPPGDALMLANQIERLACDEQLRRRLGAAGRLKVEKSYHKARLAKELLAIYSDFNSQPGGKQSRLSADMPPTCLATDFVHAQNDRPYKPNSV